jgi:putative tape measure domain protein|nr:MAG TPA: Tail tape measure [Caudoviricetes sp.]DAW41485.1 MAG TPA: Tail tape measure [Caudoviricetes sp.]
MAGINARINLIDSLSGPMQRMIATTENLINHINNVEGAMNNGFDGSIIEDARHQAEVFATQMSNVSSSINEAEAEQQSFNNSVNSGSSAMGGLVGKAIALASAYMGIGKLMNMSDELTLTTARLDMMNDKVQTTPELLNMVYQSAQNARGSLTDMADVVARFGNNAKDAFSSSREVVDFANLVQKQMTIAGAGTQEASNAMLQLSQALGSGVLRGDELNSIFEQAPNLIQSVATYMDVPIGKIREMAQEGKLSAAIVKNAIFADADNINAKFEQMPMTWGQIWTMMSNAATMKLQPLLEKINSIANSPQFQAFAANAVNAVGLIANALMGLIDLGGQIADFFVQNWSVIEPIVLGIVGALVIYNSVLAIGAVIQGVIAVATAAHAALTGAWSLATFAATAAQSGLNAALLACPLTWIIGLVIALIAIIFAVANSIAKTSSVANSGFGVITGGINVVMQFFKNLGLLVADIALGITNAILALASNMGIAFHNAIAGIQSWFYDLLSTALSVVAGIAEALNKLPFVDFDFSGISNAASDYAAKSKAAAESKQEYQDVGQAFDEGMSTFDVFQDGWSDKAFKAGAKWGDGVSDKVSSTIDGFMKSNGGVDTSNMFNGGGYTAGATVPSDVSNIAKNTKKASDSLDITNEDLKYLRDIAERDVINRFTTAEIKVDMTNNNNIASSADLDGLISDLTERATGALSMAAEGVHR